jgi:PBSX family phage terminase large subunit
VTKETIERNVLEPMREFWGAGLIGEINSRNIAKIFGERVYCLGAEKVSQVTKLRGAKFKYVYCDEIVEFHQEVFELLKSRLSLEYSVCDFTGNPSYPTHYIKNFIESGADIYCQNWTIYDNPFLPVNYVRNLEKEYAGTVYFDRYILGMWKKADGLIYPMFDEKIHIDDGQPRQYEKYYISADYGTKNPCAFLLWGLSAGVYYIIDEYYYDGRKNTPRTDDEHYAALEKLAGGRTISRVIIDPSAASFITLIRRRGKYRVTEADNAVIDGIRECCTAFKNGVIKISRKCVNTIGEIGLYSWDDKSVEDKPLKEHDHAMDAIRYFVKTMKISMPKRKGFKIA